MSEPKRPTIVEMLDDAGNTIGWGVEWEDWTVTTRMTEAHDSLITFTDLTAFREVYPHAHLRITGGT